MPESADVVKGCTLLKHAVIGIDLKKGDEDDRRGNIS